MKKAWSVIIIAFGLFSYSTAQTIREIKVNVLDADRMGYYVMFDVEQKILKDAWKRKTDEFFIKSKPSKGFDVYIAVTVPEIHHEEIDIYTKIDKLDNSRSSFTITISKGKNFITKEETEMVENVKRFLDEFIIYVKEYKKIVDEQSEKEREAAKILMEGMDIKIEKPEIEKPENTEKKEDPR